MGDVQLRRLDGTALTLDQAELDALAARLRGALVTPAAPDYDRAIAAASPGHGRSSRRPRPMPPAASM